MMDTKERQNKYRGRMYKAGFKEVRTWVKRKERKPPEKLGFTEFMRQLKRQTAGMSEESLTRLLNLLIKIANGKNEEAKLRKKK